MTKISNNSNSYNIIPKKNDLNLCKMKIKKLLSIPLDNLSNLEKNKVKYEIKMELRKIDVLQKELKKLGYSEKRGRPKKNSIEKYSYTHEKFTAMLLPKNLNYLQSLKTEKKIKSISSFLDQLIENHKKFNSIS